MFKTIKLFDKNAGNPNGATIDENKEVEGEADDVNPDDIEKEIELTDEQKQQKAVEDAKVLAETEAKAKADADAKAIADAEQKAKDDNARFARERREKERKDEIAKAKADARVESVKEAVGTNPYTNEPLVDAEDVEQYLLMKRIEKEGGDPVADYPKYFKKYRKEQYESQKETIAQEEQTKNDIKSFAEAHPEVNPNVLFADEDFILFSKGKIGNEPLTEIYADYQKLTSKYHNQTEQEKIKVAKEAEDKAARILANQKANPGNLGGTPEGNAELYTIDQLKKMSTEEWKKNLEKAEKSARHHKLMK